MRAALSMGHSACCPSWQRWARSCLCLLPLPSLVCESRWARTSSSSRTLLPPASRLQQGHSCFWLLQSSLQLQVGHDFFIFKDSADGAVKVLYRRK